ncbi:hypothetical protein BCR39DRAFT_558499 [Naematelia encephala]|uniref:Uncharacterized protein n=1 Tax=Naematelia encephala TaxID=71784 RepID=A0A1Y2B8J4_9TREE|nr:hypothetical protein BCR39DRAFT_558499 [Naematelia encephala]
MRATGMLLTSIAVASSIFAADSIPHVQSEYGSTGSTPRDQIEGSWRAEHCRRTLVDSMFRQQNGLHALKDGRDPIEDTVADEEMQTCKREFPDLDRSVPMTFDEMCRYNELVRDVSVLQWRYGVAAVEKLSKVLSRSSADSIRLSGKEPGSAMEDASQNEGDSDRNDIEASTLDLPQISFATFSGLGNAGPTTCPTATATRWETAALHGEL